jgi:hypothetical protein
MKTITITMRLIKEHKVLAEYAETNPDGTKVLKPLVWPIYVRKNEYLPAAYTLTLTPTEV